MKQLDTILRGRFPTSFFFGSLRGIIGLVLIVRLGDKHSVGFITLLYCIFDAAFRNPDFYKTQAMRLPIYIKPRIIDCSDETEQYICLPRGCEDELVGILEAAGESMKLMMKGHAEMKSV